LEIKRKEVWVNGYTFTIAINTIYDLVGVFLTVLIIFHLCVSIYYGTKMMIIKHENKFGWCPEMLVTYMSVLWLILFVYIFVGILGENKLIVSDSFGAIFIRPMILVSIVIETVLQKRRYIAAVNKYKTEDFSKKKSEQED
jgi:hypothetical protein